MGRPSSGEPGGDGHCELNGIGRGDEKGMTYDSEHMPPGYRPLAF